MTKQIAVRAERRPFGAFLADAIKLGPTARAYGGLSMDRRLKEQNASLGRMGSLEVRLATKAGQVRRAQKLRWRVFYEELRAIPDAPSRIIRRDVDSFDAICDHLIVLDHDDLELTKLGKLRPRIVGTYRLLRGDVARRNGGFYSESEFDLSGLFAAHPDARFLELGRSCVLPAYRTKRTVELLWHGIWAYVVKHDIDVMFGCASLEGTNPDALALPLSFLHHHAKAPDVWNARALAQRFVSMDRMDKDSIRPKDALNALPPLLKGYLRVGCSIGDGAVVDHQFNTTDVLVILPRERIAPRYVSHYGADAARYA